MKNQISSVALALVFSAAPGFAQQPGEGAAGSGLPAAATANGITYLCGGVGSDEAAAMKQAASQYSLMLTFANAKGDYVADVDVAITDAHGQSVFSAACAGPIMLVKMPKAGRYQVRAERSGRALTRSVQLRPNGKVTSVELTWPARQPEQS